MASIGKKFTKTINSEGCMISTSHKLNHDGYLRKHDNGKGLIMWHRKVWQDAHGEIPEGYEVDHMCKNRACFRLNHLQLLTTHEHRVKDNTGRWDHKKKEALDMKEKHPEMNGMEIATVVEASFSSVYRWLRQLKITKENTV